MSGRHNESSEGRFTKKRSKGDAKNRNRNSLRRQLIAYAKSTRRGIDGRSAAFICQLYISYNRVHHEGVRKYFGYLYEEQVSRLFRSPIQGR